MKYIVISCNKLVILAIVISFQMLILQILKNIFAKRREDDAAVERHTGTVGRVDGDVDVERGPPHAGRRGDEMALGREVLRLVDGRYEGHERVSVPRVLSAATIDD